MESILVSTGVVALAEIGYKTQLLAFILAARFKKHLPNILNILVAAMVNHGLAGAMSSVCTRKKWLRFRDSNPGPVDYD